MTGNVDFDVLVSGYGPTGAVAANLLGQRGLRVLVVDPARGIFDIPRAVHFDGECMRVFQNLGLAGEIIGLCGLATGVSFVSGSGRTLMSAGVEDFEVRHAWPSANFFPQPRLEARLRAGVERFPSVRVRLGVGVAGIAQDEERVQVELRRDDGVAMKSVTTHYLLGCDGASSPTRDLVGLPLDDLRCDQPWLVCDLMLPEGVEYRRRCYQFCDWRRPVTLVPAAGGHVRWEFMVMPGEDPAELEREENVRALMAPHLHRLNDELRPDQGVLVRKKVYTFHGLVAPDWRAGRVLILGDAAHQTPPFLGQGLCAGIRDAFNLCWKLDGVIGGRFHPDVLDSYTREREPHVREVVEQAVRVGRVIQARSRGRALLRDAFFRLAAVIPRLKSRFLWEPAWPLGPGLFDSASPPGRDTAHGNPLDQALLERASGEGTRLDGVLGPEFALVGIDVDPVQMIDEDTTKRLSELSARIVHVATRPAPENGPDTLVDSSGVLGRWLERVGERPGAGCVALLRPDRQVFGLYAAARGAALGAEIARGVESLAAQLRGEARR